MNLEKKAIRINKAHQLILEEKTGTPFEFANKLNISKSQLYNLIGILKEYDAPIKSCKKINSFYYSKPFFLELKYSLKTILDEENKNRF
jgi:predicted transcriptional regulator